MQAKNTQSLHILSHKLSEMVFDDIELKELKIYAGMNPAKAPIELADFRQGLNDKPLFDEFVAICIEEHNLFKNISDYWYSIMQSPRQYIKPEHKGTTYEKELAETIVRHKECKLFIFDTISNFEQKLLSKKYRSRWSGALETLSPQIGQLKNLEILDLSCNGLRKLPDEIVDLQELRSINLSDNLFSEIPKVLSNLKNLQYIDLQFNPIKAPFDTDPVIKYFTAHSKKIKEQKAIAVENQHFEEAAKLRDELENHNIKISEDFYFDYSTMFHEIYADLL